uniref:Uncharacterized protein n=1 Tax=Oryza rufipogon TaxID=4529 RepID=A0A0E0R059_ORYRU
MPPPLRSDAAVALAIGPRGHEAYMVAKTRAAGGAGEEEARVGGEAGEGEEGRGSGAYARPGWPPTSPTINTSSTVPTPLLPAALPPLPGPATLPSPRHRTGKQRRK